MASRKYGIGVTVERKAIETFQKANVMAEFSNSCKTAILRGTITAKGAGLKWIQVEWIMGGRKLVSEHWGVGIDIVGALNRRVAARVVQAVGGAPVDSDHSSDMDINENNSDVPSGGASEAEGAADDEEEEPDSSDPLQPLLVDGVQWAHEKDGVPVCYGESQRILSGEARINWPTCRVDSLTPQRSRLEYFLLMFQKEIDNFCTWTGKKLGGEPLTKHEFVKFLGVMIAVCRK